MKILPAMGYLFNRVGSGRLSSQWGHNEVIRNPEPKGFFNHEGSGTVLGVTPRYRLGSQLHSSSLVCDFAQAILPFVSPCSHL